MNFRTDFTRIVAALLMAGLPSACGGKAFTVGAEPGEDSGSSTGDSGGWTGTNDGGSSCVDVTITPSDVSCGSDQDCDLIRSGEVCNGQCSCGDTPVNAAAASRFQTETASLKLASCPCAFPGEPRCLAGQCTLCGVGSNQPAGCADSGITIYPIDGATVDTGSTEIDSGLSTGDGGTCVDIVLSTYDQSCTQAKDCILIQTGDVCSGNCACGGSPVNVSEQSRYDQATSGIVFGLCPCPAEFAPQCVNNTCVGVTSDPP
jgi:hypothetical protein